MLTKSGFSSFHLELGRNTSEGRSKPAQTMSGWATAWGLELGPWPLPGCSVNHHFPLWETQQPRWARHKMGSRFLLYLEGCVLFNKARSMTWKIGKAAFSELERFWNKPSSHSSSARNAWEGKWRRRVILKLQGEKLLLFFWVGETVKTISFLQALMRRNTAVKKLKNLVTNSTESWSTEAAPRRFQHVPWRQPALGPLTPRTGGRHVQGEPARARRDTAAGTYTTCHCWEQKQFRSVEKNYKSFPI